MGRIVVTAVLGIAVGAIAAHAFLTRMSPNDLDHQVASPAVEGSVADEVELPQPQFLVRNDSDFSDKV